MYIHDTFLYYPRVWFDSIVDNIDTSIRLQYIAVSFIFLL